MSAETPDYKTTLNLPKTDFPMRAGLPKKEPEILARWKQMNLYRKLREEYEKQVEEERQKVSDLEAQARARAERERIKAERAASRNSKRKAGV